MIRDSRRLPRNTTLHADICIVGAGAAGITLAKSFIGTPYRVILLESGGLKQDSKVEALNVGETNALFGSLENNRLRYFGGTTNHWEGYCSPLEDEDFASRDWVKHSGWPITPGELLPYYHKALGVLQAPANSLNYSPRENDVSHKDVNIRYRFQRPMRFGQDYREALEKAPNIDVLLFANLVKIQDHGTRQVTAIKAATLTTIRFTVKAKRYVLACGALENTRLLLASSNNMMFAAVNKHGWLGKCFMQHPHLDAALLYHSLADRTEHTQFDHMIAARPEYLRYWRLLNFAVKVHNFKDVGCVARSIPHYMEKMLAAPGDFHRKARLRVLCEQVPSRDSTVSLSDKTDALGMPRIKIDWKLGEQEMRTLKHATALLARLFGKAGKGIVWQEEWLREGKFPEQVWGGCHHMGTVRMSESAETGVVDRNCRVHGAGNLYVAGSAVFPTSGSANPTLTIIALALRLADHLKSRL